MDTLVYIMWEVSLIKTFIFLFPQRIHLKKVQLNKCKIIKPINAINMTQKQQWNKYCMQMKFKKENNGVDLNEKRTLARVLELLEYCVWQSTDL